MDFIAIDTTMSQLSLAISVKGKDKAVVIDAQSKKHNSMLMPQIDKLLKDVDCQIDDIDVFGVVNGPGSFTGIRIGIATINAFNLALNKKIIEITALELAGYNRKNEKVLAMIDCRHNNYYAALFDGNNVDYMEINVAQAKEINARQIIYNKPDSNALFNIMKEKISNNDFVDRAQPFYMKLSSAERLYGK